MASDQANGGADRQSKGETGRPDDPWQRIETEKPQRDAARKAWDAEHDTSPEFEYAIRPLDNDDGRDRPRSRDLTEEQRAELAEVFGRPVDELLALRDKDPRAGHNRDEAGRILDHDGNPREDKTPEQILREAERQANLYGPNTQRTETEPTAAPDLRAPSSDQPDETSRDSGTGQQAGPPEGLNQLLGRLALDLRDGKLTTAEAANQLGRLRGNSPQRSGEQRSVPEAESKDEPPTYGGPSDVREALLSGKSRPRVERELIDQPTPSTIDSDTELVRDQDGYRYELGTPTDDSVAFGTLVATEQAEDGSKTDRQDRAREGRIEAVGGLADQIAQNVDRLEKITMDLGPPPPSAADCRTGQLPPEVYPTPQHPTQSLGNEFAVLTVLYVVGDAAYRKAGEKYLRWYHQPDEGRDQNDDHPGD